MSKGNDPAYPGSKTWNDDNGNCGIPYGLSKREYFAGLAMQGLCARDDGEASHYRAAYAVEHADALLSELEKTA